MNNSQNRTVVFITHDAFRAGAPIILLNFLRWFKANTQIPFIIVVREAGGAQGELLPEFRELAPTYLFNPVPGRIGRLFQMAGRAAGLDMLSPHRRRLLKHIRRHNPGLIYSNTVVNGDVLELLAALDCPVITHVHELQYCIDYYAGRDNFDAIMRNTNRYIAVSKAVRESLVSSYGIAPEKVSIVYGFIPVAARCDYGKVTSLIRDDLGIPPDALVVGGAGTTDWRKGTDIFIQLAGELASRNLPVPVHFVWVGGADSGPVHGQLMHDVERLGLAGKVHFVGHKRKPFEFFSMFDVFALTSREDPFPLVVLETASLGIPSVCFSGAGGAPEFIEDDCGFVAPYLDVEIMSDRLCDMLNDAEQRKRFGARAAEKVRERHNIAINAQAVTNIVRDVMSG
ncbi:MAG: glycosyltransferase family 4 protein [Nitrospirae bacterium]|nr:glycosyltransferase family 4 protein [Nitrospirota bacterium]